MTDRIEVYYCEKKTNCNWKCFALDAHGLGYGIIPSVHNAWRIWHDNECGGKLIQAEIVTPDSTPPSDKPATDLMGMVLTDEEMRTFIRNNLWLLDDVNTAPELLFMIAKAQLQKIQPLLDALKQENEGLKLRVKQTHHDLCQCDICLNK